jgi:hypothetical protein
MIVPETDGCNENLEETYINACLIVYLFHAPTPTMQPPKLDWDIFYRLLEQNKLVGLFAIIGRTYPNLWPQSIKKRLREDRYRQFPYVDWCIQQVKIILTALNQSSIPVIVLKGWSLIPLVYDGDPSQRPTSDIDLLVLPKDVPRVTEVFRKLKYQQGEMEPWPGYFRRYINSAHYLSSQTYPPLDQAFNVDLHWGFPDAPYYDRRINVESFIERAQPLIVAGIQANRLAIEDYLIYASVHMAHHGYQETLSRFYEIAVLILRKNPSITWPNVVNNASIWRVVMPLRRMISRLEKLWPGIIPGDVIADLDRLKASGGEKIIDWCLIHSTRKEAMIIILSCLNTPGLLWRLRFSLETSFPGPTYLNQYFGPAPGNFWPLIYFRRFYRFLHG